MSATLKMFRTLIDLRIPKGYGLGNVNGLLY